MNSSDFKFDMKKSYQTDKQKRGTVHCVCVWGEREEKKPQHHHFFLIGFIFWKYDCSHARSFSPPVILLSDVIFASNQSPSKKVLLCALFIKYLTTIPVVVGV